MPSPGCSRTRAEKPTLPHNKLQGEYNMSNRFLQEATEIIRGQMVYVADLGQIMLAKLTPGREEAK